jgi:hypothetical protein
MRRWASEALGFAVVLASAFAVWLLILALTGSP